MAVVQQKEKKLLADSVDHKVVTAKPLLKWVGGKGQLLKELAAKSPRTYGTYIEPFFGGGALYFHLQPECAIIADSNPELINLYRVVGASPELVIKHLSRFENSKTFFLKQRARDWRSLSPAMAAARTIYLNKTCFNGLYRVNKSGQFNVPFGNYSKPKIVDSETILAASKLLRRATIVLGDYKQVLRRHARPGDFVFLDPPYLPISKYSDFKRYTKDQFYEEDHLELAEEVKRLHELGCQVVLTNSNHPLVHKLYGSFDIEVVKTKRYINSDSSKRVGEDVIVTAVPGKKTAIRSIALPVQMSKYPSTRYMGSKNKLLDSIWSVASQFNFDSVIDLFSGSGVVSYMFKSQGKSVLANDYMSMAATHSLALIENNEAILSQDDIDLLMSPNAKNDFFVTNTFKDLYYSDSDNNFIDQVRTNSKLLKGHKRSVAISALIRACIKKRPRGIFTYVGARYDDGRRDLKLSLQDQFLSAVEQINGAVFDNGRKNSSRWGDAMSVTEKADLVYIDPPYFSPLSDNEYVRRYHFVEGLARDWKDVEIQHHTLTKKFKSYPTPFSTQKGAADAFDKLFKKFKDSILIVSYSSNSLPALDEMVEILSRHKGHVDVLQIDHQYSFGNQGDKLANRNNAVKEYLFVGY